MANLPGAPKRRYREHLPGESRSVRIQSDRRSRDGLRSPSAAQDARDLIGTRVRVSNSGSYTCDADPRHRPLYCTSTLAFCGLVPQPAALMLNPTSIGVPAE